MSNEITSAADSTMELIEVVQRLSLARDLPTVQNIVRQAARKLTGADGATFVLRDNEQCHYVDEDAIAPLWKGQRFPLSACISGWVMLNREPAVIEDIYTDHRIPHDAYRPTFVKSLVMVPIRTLDPIGAIGNYWAEPHQPTPRDVQLLRALADTTAVALENVRVFTELEQRVKNRTAELETANEKLSATNRDLLSAQQQADRVFAAYAKALPGTVLDGKYRLEEELSSGGYGVVFRGRHLVLNNEVAIKVFRPVPGNDSAVDLQRFLREGAAAARVNHPNAVRVLDSGVSAEGIAFLIMELLHGQSLAEELNAVGLLPLRRAVRIVATVADVLAQAHRVGMIHRDIKPDNIFLHTVDGTEVVKVVDFGIAKFFDGPQSAGNDRLTRTGEYMGTPRFIAPERVSCQLGDGRSDVYSLGVVLYELICGVWPWTRFQQHLILEGDFSVMEPAPMRYFRRGVSTELEALVRRTLTPDASDRPTAAELAAELRELMERLPADSPPTLRLESIDDSGTQLFARPAPQAEQQTTAHPPRTVTEE